MRGAIIVDSLILTELLCSGIGRTLALQYAAAGVKLCIVGRRQSELDTVKAECLRVQAHRTKGDSATVLSVVGDFTNPEDMVRVRTEIETGMAHHHCKDILLKYLVLKAWKGLDTVIVSAGVSAIQPLMSLAGLKEPRSTTSTTQVSASDMQRAVDTVFKAVNGNFTGPLVAALAFVCCMDNTCS